ncbi:MAG: PQQ-dependent sugar dehydrogenase [Comamonadaceae bacterium]|nr:PQQ-dependent sugar dehydrogenase [Comamonadaceae bacterium]
MPVEGPGHRLRRGLQGRDGHAGGGGRRGRPAAGQHAGGVSQGLRPPTGAGAGRRAGRRADRRQAALRLAGPFLGAAAAARAGPDAGRAPPAGAAGRARAAGAARRRQQPCTGAARRRAQPPRSRCDGRRRVPRLLTPPARQHPRRPTMRPFGAVLPLFILSAAAAAQGTETEAARAFVQRLAPAVLPFSESFANRLQAPPGFTVTVFASGLGQPRMMETGADGTVYVTRRGSDDVVALRDDDGDGRADSRRVAVAGLTGVHGIDRRGGELLLASSTTVWSWPLDGSAAPAVLVSGLPDGGQHPNRTVRVGPDGGLYVSVGSSRNDCAEENQLERATMIRYGADGRERRVVANGLRNTIGYDWHPTTAVLWGWDHGSDFRGDRVPPEELNRIVDGRHYGWPIRYARRHVDPVTNAPPERLALEPGQAEPLGTPMSREDFCARTEPAVLLVAAHSAPMAMRFYTAPQFPPAWRGGAFVAMRGSWNRSEPVGYEVRYVPFGADGEPGASRPFVTGFVDRQAPAVLGRPVGIVVAADGALLVSDDTNGAIYRIAWTGRR